MKFVIAILFVLLLCVLVYTIAEYYREKRRMLDIIKSLPVMALIIGFFINKDND